MATRHIKIIPGQKVAIPSSATNISVIESGNITLEATDDCVDLSNTQTLECYSFGIGETNNDRGRSAVFETVTINGVVYDDITYTFSTPLHFGPGAFGSGTTISPSPADLQAAIIQKLPQLDGLIAEMCGAVNMDNDNDGMVGVYYFKTTETVAAKLKLLTYGEGVTSGPNSGSVTMLLPALAVDDQPVLEGDWKPECGCATGIIN